ncbi:MAG: hypothetical protein LC667_12310 [Thioalkalivibrio sp.]|nr:hypothetical protein [Thioalkalivibrio sp.]
MAELPVVSGHEAVKAFGKIGRYWRIRPSSGTGGRNHRNTQSLGLTRKHAVQAIFQPGLRGALFREGVVNGPWVVRLAGPAGVGFLLASCSFGYVQGPPAGHAVMDDFRCETSFGLPLIDLGVGAGLVIWGITAGETTSDNFGQPVESSATDNLVTGLVLGVPFIVGAGWGAREVARCRSARAALAKRAGDAAARLSTRPGPIFP